MTDLQGALGVVQVEKLKKFTEQRIANATFLTGELQKFVKTPVTCLDVAMSFISIRSVFSIIILIVMNG